MVPAAREKHHDVGGIESVDAAEVAPAFRRQNLYVGGLLLATALVYARALRCGFVFDDLRLIVNNPSLAHWSFLWEPFTDDVFSRVNPSVYRPLTDVWFALERHLGMGAWGWHAGSIALHLIAVWLVFKLGVRLAGDVPVALLAAALFALMPVQAEAVVWISAAGIPLATVFELGALLAFTAPRNLARRYSPLAFVLYLLALFSYDGAVIFPGIIAMYVVLLESPGTAGEGAALWPRVRQAVVRTAPFVLEALLYLGARRVVLGSVLNPMPELPQNLNTQLLVDNTQVLLTLPRVIASYLGLLLAPFLAGPAHRVLRVLTPNSPEFYLPLISLVVAVLALFLLVRRESRRRLYAFYAGWTALALLPMMNLRAIHPDLLVCDRYLYLSSVGWSLLLADWALGVARKIAWAKPFVWGAAAVMLAGYSVSLRHLEGFWRDDIALFTRCLQVFPESALCHAHLGVALQFQGDLNRARAELEKAVALDRFDSASTLYSLGELDAKLGDLSRATNEIEAAIKLRRALSQKKTKAMPPAAYIPLAELYEQEGDFERSQALLRYVRSLPQGDEAADMAQARIDWRHGKTADAQAILLNLTRHYPSDPKVWIMFGLAMGELGDSEQALAAYQHALAINPYDARARFFEAHALHAMGRDGEALAQCRLALAAAPGDTEVRNLIAEIERTSAHQ